MTSDEPGSTGLERVLGLPTALAIGVGTMVGAGVFLFPGIAGGRAGSGAVLSFALCGAIALLIATCTAELASAMPDSGGAYRFVLRTFGPLAGTLVGVAQWVGLVFASAFYLVGFGRYATRLLDQAGVPTGEPAVWIALGTALALTAVNVVGARRAGGVQVVLVVVLVGVLGLLFGYGVLRVTGALGEPRWPEGVLVQGWQTVLRTAALVFTSFLGFLQIATVAGEVREPRRTLPLALIGSVLFATALYVLVLFVSTGVLSQERLGELGETAVIEVARELIGPAGALAILVAGLLATLSSANASVLSASRGLFALGRDRLAPPATARVGARARTPRVALVSAGVPIAGLVFFDRLEVLAEVASVLHLVIYGLVCVALVAQRRRAADDYRPSFRAPGGVWVGVLGAAASFALIAFMDPLSMALGAAVLAAALAWYAAYGRRRGTAPDPARR